MAREVKIGDKIQHRRERIMSKRENQDGYYIAKLNVNKKSKSIAIHRLVAMAFVENPYGYNEVNHKDCNRKNNVYTNLEWCTHKQNIIHSTKLGHYSTPCGKENYNYGNHKLHHRFLSEPELRKVQSRPGARNGRAKQVSMFDLDGNLVKRFEWIGQCADYLGITPNSARNAIKRSIQKSEPYKGYIFRY